MLTDLGHPFADGEPVYDVTFENVQAGLRTDYLFRLANQRGGIVLGTGDLSELALGWCTYGVGDQMSPLQRQRRRAEDADPAPDPLGDRRPGCSTTRSARCCRRARHRDQPELVPAGEGEQSSRARPRSARTRCRTSPCSTCCATASGRRRSRFLAWHAWREPRRGAWPPGFPDGSAPPTTLAEIGHWLEVFLQRFFAFSQFKRSALPNGPKVSPAGPVAARRLAGAVGRFGRRVAAGPRALGRRHLGRLTTATYAAADEEEPRRPRGSRKPRNATATATNARPAIAHPARMSVTKCSPP